MRLIVMIVLFFSAAWADDSRVELPLGQVHEGDYFTYGSAIEISGHITGDAYILAAQAFIDGTIDGDLLIAGGNVEVSGNVGGSIRVLSGQLSISGHVGRNISLIAGNALIASSAQVQGGVISIGGNVDLAGVVDKEALAVASNLRVSSYIKQDLTAYVGEMRITSRAHVVGDVDYQSNNAASIDPVAKIEGKITQRPSLVDSVIKGKLRGLLIGSKVATFLMHFLYSFLIGWILLKFFPKKIELSVSELRKHPLKAFSFGLLLLVLLPFISLLLLMTVIGAPFALTLIALNVIGFYTAKIISIFWASNYCFSKIHLKSNRLGSFALGLTVYFLLMPIPIFGFILSIAAMLFGVGAVFLAETSK